MNRSRFLALAAVLAVVAVPVLSGCGSPRRAEAAPTTTTVPATTTTTLPPTPEPRYTDVATLSANVTGYLYPHGPASGTVPASWYGFTSELPVIQTEPGWLKVRLAQRPNQSTAWIPIYDASLSTTPYYLVLNLTTMHLTVFLHGEPIGSFPAGVGTTTDPTVTGHYFIAMKAPPPNSSYGPFVLATSAHSDAIDNWEGMGDAIIGIHGPITSYDDQLIGTTGARISHGCVRLHDADLATLANVPGGTPLDIVA